MAKRVAGTLDVGSLTVPHGETFVLDGSLEVRATGDIMILGRIVSDGRTAPGSAVKLSSNGGSILIAGRIATAPGAAGDSPPVSTSVVAGDGRPGGNIEIASAGYLVILQSAELETGYGGSGGNARAEGFGPAHALVKAVSGAGAPGGAIVLSAADLFIVEGALRAGAGGWGGEAIAVGQPAEGRRQRGGPAVVEATGRPGGSGGDIALATTTKGMGVLKLAGRLRAGDGGSSFKATASGATRATALLEPGGRGGNISITLLESPLALQDAGCTLTPGNGGDCGDRTITVDPDEPPRIFFEGAVATATQDALAWVGHPAERGKPAGGAAGTLIDVALWPGPPELRDPLRLTAQQSHAGSSTDSVATVGATSRRDSDGVSALGAVPGKATKAQVP